MYTHVNPRRSFFTDLISGIIWAQDPSPMFPLPSSPHRPSGLSLKPSRLWLPAGRCKSALQSALQLGVFCKFLG